MKKYLLSDENVFHAPCVFLLGGFDGIHCGHKKLIEKAKEFYLPIGMMTINGAKSSSSLFTMEEREEIFEQLGVSFVLETEFSEEFKNTSAEAFLSLITERFNVKAFVCGKDFRFGKGASGTPAFLREKTGILVFDEDISIDGDGRKISTTTVKELLKEGKVEEANRILATPFCVTGEVIHGRRVGESMGFPTANMIYPENKTPIQDAVYAVSVSIGGKKYRGIANYGRCPTFDISYKLVETYIDGFSGDLYGKTLRVYFDAKIRDIKKFSGKEELTAQLSEDIEKVRSGRI